MDTRHRKKKFNSISSIFSKQDGSGASKGFGCRVRFPIYSCSFVKGNEDDYGDEGEIKGMEVVSFKEVKKEEEKRREELTIESDVAGGNRIEEEQNGYLSGTEIRNKTPVSSDKKEEDTSINLGMGVGLMLLLSKSTTELNKMVELRKEMETLLVDLNNEIKKKNVPTPTSTDNSNNAPVSLSTSGGNENSIDCTIPLQEDGASNHTDGRLDKSVTEIEDMEAELELELKRLQLTEESNNLPPLLIRKIEPTDESDYLTDNFYDNFEDYTDNDEQPIEEEIHDQDEQGDADGDYDHFTRGVNPHELERRLNEVLQSRQRERIEELEYALECAKSKLFEKEKEICWWQDTARLVTLHNDDSHFRF